MITHRKPAETMRDYFKREYALCMSRVDKYYVLQSLRRDQGYFGAALFYQNEAARWHDRAMECRHQWLISSWRKPCANNVGDLVAPPRVSPDWSNYRDTRPSYSPQQKAPIVVDGLALRIVPTGN
jgi:hypothetical protein